MYQHGYIAFFISLLMCGCFSNKAATFDGLVSYEIPTHPLIQEIVTQAKPLIDAIVAEELEICRKEHNLQEINNKLSMAWKNNYRLTLYYLNSYQEHATDDIKKIVANIANTSDAGSAYFSSKIAFFGKNQDSLVIKINDTDVFLSELHEKLKNRFHQEQKAYSKTHKKHLYSIQESERFPYQPHVHIGTLYIRSKATLDDRKHLEPVLQKIFKRIENEILPIIQKTIANFPDKKISVDSITLVNLTKRIVHEPYFQLHE